MGNYDAEHLYRQVIYWSQHLAGQKLMHVVSSSMYFTFRMDVPLNLVCARESQYVADGKVGE